MYIPIHYLIDGSSQGQPGLLPSTKSHSILPNLCPVPSRQDVKILRNNTRTLMWKTQTMHSHACTVQLLHYIICIQKAEHIVLIAITSCSAQAWITFSYLSALNSLPKRMLSRTVACWIHDSYSTHLHVTVTNTSLVCP